jgi:hypothetical protein
MTDEEWNLIEATGSHVPGPRHMTSVDAHPETLRLVKSLIEQGRVESTGHIERLSEPIVRVCLTLAFERGHSEAHVMPPDRRTPLNRF